MAREPASVDTMQAVEGRTQPGLPARPTVPWSLAQTAAGVLLTLVPWLAFALATNALGGGSSTSSRAPVPRNVDIATGFAVFILSALLECVFVIAPLIVAWRVRAPEANWRERLGWLGLRRAPIGRSLVVVVVGVIIGIGSSALYSWIISVFNLGVQTNTDTLLAQGKAAPFTTIGLLAAAALVAPICEELFFRGFAFAGLARSMPVFAAILLSSGLFAVAHADVGSLIPLFVIGMVLAWARWRTDSLWPGIAIHALNNILAAATLIPLLFK